MIICYGKSTHTGKTYDLPTIVGKYPKFGHYYNYI